MEALALEKGRRYRIIRPGAHLSGFVPIAPYTSRGARIDLEPGDEVEYLGLKYSGGSDGIDVHAWKLVSREHEDARFCFDLYPQHPERGSIFDTRPHPEFLALVDEETTDG